MVVEKRRNLDVEPAVSRSANPNCVNHGRETAERDGSWSGNRDVRTDYTIVCRGCIAAQSDFLVDQSAVSGDGAALWASVCGCPSEIVLCAPPSPFGMQSVEFSASVALRSEGQAVLAPRYAVAGAKCAGVFGAVLAPAASVDIGDALRARSRAGAPRGNRPSSTDFRDRTVGRCGPASGSARSNTGGSHRAARRSSPEPIRFGHDGLPDRRPLCAATADRGGLLMEVLILVEGSLQRQVGVVANVHGARRCRAGAGAAPARERRTRRGHRQE
jgi:hypothetical protein